MVNIQPHWTEERIKDLRTLAQDKSNYSASQIGARLGVSRNSIIGKLHRIGVPLIGKRGSNGSKLKLTSAPAKPRRTVGRTIKIGPKRNGGSMNAVRFIEATEIADLPPDRSSFACTITDLGTDMCRWPLGEPSADMLYCGAPSNGSWCSRHHRLVFPKKTV